MESSEDVPRERYRPWTDSEARFVSTHREDGYLLISEGLAGRGRRRSPGAVKVFALRRLGISLSKYPSSGMRKCVSCGQWDARPNTQAGRAGFCPTCWKRRKAAAMREGAAEHAADAEYDREKKARRARKKKGKQNG